MDAVPQSARAFLYAPGHRPRLLDKAMSGATGADVVIIDLEDGVPANAREQAVANLTGLAARSKVRARPAVLCRIGSDTRRLPDLALTPEWFHGVVLAKAEDVDDVVAIGRAAATRPGAPALWLLVESARGVENLPAMLGCGTAVAGVQLGAGDLRADLGLVDDDPRMIDVARTRIVYACAAAGVRHVVDTPEARIDPDAAFAAAVANARGLGFSGKCAIHPNQVGAIQLGFAPTGEQLAWARRVLNVDDGAQRMGDSLVDEATRRAAHRLLAATSAGADDGHVRA